MAQSRTYFGLRRGSTKTQTFSVLNGKQITKDRQEGGRNPQTPEQMQQRMVMATVSAAYAQMKRIVDHSFEGVTYGGQTMAEFIKVNAAVLRSALSESVPEFAFNYYRDRAMYPGAYIMSRGSAPAVTQVSNGGSSGFHFNDSTTSAGTVAFDIQLPSSLGDRTANRVLETLNVQVGDMATACFAYPLHNADGYGFTFVRFKFIKAGSEIITAENFADYITIEAPFEVAITHSTNSIGFVVSIPDCETNFPFGHCVIHSLKTATGWKRSNESLLWSVGTDFTPTAEDAFASYPVGPSYVLNGGQV